MGCNCGGRRTSGAQRAAIRKAAIRKAARKLAKKLPAAQTNRPAAANTVTPAARQAVPRLVMAKATTYAIVRGDTIASIASKFSMTTGELLRFDGGTGRPNLARLRSRNAHVIAPGEVILVPRIGK